MAAIYDGIHGELLDDLKTGIEHLTGWLAENFDTARLDADQEIFEFAEPCAPSYTGDLLMAAYESTAALYINGDLEEEERGRSIPDIIRDRYVKVLVERLTMWFQEEIEEYEECEGCGGGFKEDDLYYTDDDDGPYCSDCLDRLG